MLTTFKILTNTVKTSMILLENRAKLNVCKSLWNVEQNDINFIEELLKSDKEYEIFARKYFKHASHHNCYIIHPYVKWGPKKVRDSTPERRLEEAVSLIRTLDPWKVYKTITVPLSGLHKKTIFGSGTLEKLKREIRDDTNITAIFINMGTLRNMQLRELELEFGVPIFDRYKIVMQILKLHAVSTHAKLQVALAEIPYLKSRLRKDDFDIVTSDNYEIRKFVLQNREQKLKAAIDKLKSQRNLLRNRRKQMDYPVVAIVGYTNAGKTSLIKALTREQKLQPKDYLFATLDVTVHAGLLPSNLKVLYVDTVGFISDIPTSLIECFVVTLEDAMLADVIIHVEDLSNKDLIHQRNHVVDTLENLAHITNSKHLSKKIIRVGNKCDLINTNDFLNEDSIIVSAEKHIGIDVLQKKIEETILEVTERQTVIIRVSPDREEMSWLYKNSAVIAVTGNEDSDLQNMKIIITRAKLEQFKHYFIKK